MKQKKKKKKTTSVYYKIDLNRSRVEDAVTDIRKQILKASTQGNYQGLVLDIFPFTHPAYEAQKVIARYLGAKHRWLLAGAGDARLGEKELLLPDQEASTA